jgi:hypothetical protein
LIISHFDSGSLLEEKDQARACLRKFAIKAINFRANILGKIDSMLLKILRELIRRIPKMPDMFIFLFEHVHSASIEQKSTQLREVKLRGYTLESMIPGLHQHELSFYLCGFLLGGDSVEASACSTALTTKPYGL